MKRPHYFFCAKIKAVCIPGPKASWEERGLLGFHFHTVVHPRRKSGQKLREAGHDIQGPWRGAAS